jgi:hypothetical protein
MGAAPSLQKRLMAVPRATDQIVQSRTIHRPGIGIGIPARDVGGPSDALLRLRNVIYERAADRRGMAYGFFRIGACSAHWRSPGIASHVLADICY